MIAAAILGTMGALLLTRTPRAAAAGIAVAITAVLLWWGAWSVVAAGAGHVIPRLPAGLSPTALNMALAGAGWLMATAIALVITRTELALGPFLATALLWGAALFVPRLGPISPELVAVWAWTAGLTLLMALGLWRWSRMWDE
ncbi:MAG: hypothetical protein ACU0DW_09060 [Shimia sp.]